MKFQAPELLCPAGSLEKLKVAVLYGASAVYLGGMKYGLREAADNFTTQELREGTEFAHQRNVQVFVVLNGFLHDDDLESLPEFLSVLEDISVDAVIVSDLGVMSTVRKYSQIAIHLSTQASCLNVEAAKFWKAMGATRLVLGREVSVEEAVLIKKEANIEVELFVHGSMCMAYSGNCVISNYTQGRDSNRGGCAHSCRFEYSLTDQETDKKGNFFFMSSKDLMGIQALGVLIEAGVDSLKIEGRMKGQNYAGTVAKVYRQAIDDYCLNGHFQEEDLRSYEEELKKVKHRDYFSGSLLEKAQQESVFDEREHVDTEYSVSGIILEAKHPDFMLVEVIHQFSPSEILEIVLFRGKNQQLNLSFVTDIVGNPVLKTHPGQLVKVPFVEGGQKYNIIRGRV